VSGPPIGPGSDGSARSEGAVRPSARQPAVVSGALKSFTDEEVAAYIARELGVRRARHVASLLKPDTPRPTRRRAPKPDAERAAFIRLLVTKLTNDIAQDDPEQLLVLTELRAHVEQRVADAIARQGKSRGWPEVGEMLGMTRQGARQAYGMHKP
jgi:hypothetical protein